MTVTTTTQPERTPTQQQPVTDGTPERPDSFGARRQADAHSPALERHLSTNRKRPPWIAGGHG